MDEPGQNSLSTDEHPPLRPDLEAITVEEVSRLLDDVASREESWRLFELRVHEPLGLPLIGERGIRNGCPLDVALDAVHYRLTFDSSRVALLPKSEAADHTWPSAVEKAPAECISAWQMFGNAVGDHALRARFAHLLFQAKAGSGRDLAGAASDAYLQAVADGWGPIDRMDFALAALRLALAVKNGTRAQQAARAVRDEAIRCLGDNAPGIAARGVVILARVQSLPFDFDAVAEQVIAADIGDNNCDHVYAAWIDRQKPEDREPLWRRRVQAAVDAADAVRAGRHCGGLKASALGPARK